HDRPFESARQSIDRAKARRNFSLEFRFDREPDIGRGIGFHRRFGAEEIKVASESATAIRSDDERFEMGIRDLKYRPILAVLHHWIVDHELVGRGYDVVGAVALIKKIAGDAKFPVVIRIVNQGRFREYTFEPKMIREKPDQAAARRSDRV